MAEAHRDRRGHGSAIRHALRTLWNEIPSDHLLTVAAGLAYYAVFGLLPGLAAAAALLGHGDGFASLTNAAKNGHGLVPPAAVHLFKQFVTSVPKGFGGGIGLTFNLALVVWTAQRAATGLLTALNIVYDIPEERGPLRRNLVALGVGVCGIALFFAALLMVTLLPLLAAVLQPQIAIVLLWLRWPALALIFICGLALLFRYAPHRNPPRWRWVIAGTLIATLLWIAASAGVSYYAAHLASYGRFYGSLGGIAILLLWFYASILAILLGAEIDALLNAREEGQPPSRLKTELRRRERAKPSHRKPANP